MENNLIKVMGQCHCGAVKFEVECQKRVSVYQCNCSICIMKQNHHFVVNKQKFRLIEGEDYITEYQFNTKQAKHKFCKICGVQSFYQPRSNPDGIGVTIYCIQNYEQVFTEGIDWKTYDGKNWEKQYQTSDIKNESKQ